MEILGCAINNLTDGGIDTKINGEKAIGSKSHDAVKDTTDNADIAKINDDSFCPVTGTEKYERRTRLKERGICRSKNVASLRG